MHWLDFSFIITPFILSLLTLGSLVLFIVKYEYLQRLIMWGIIWSILILVYRLGFVEQIILFYRLLMIAELILTVMVLTYLLANTSLVDNKDVFLFSFMLLLFQTILIFGFSNNAILFLFISLILLWILFGVYVFIRKAFDHPRDRWLLLISWAIGMAFMMLGGYGLLSNFAFQINSRLWGIQTSANGLPVLVLLFGCLTLTGTPPFGTWILNVVYTKKMYFVPYGMFQMLRLGLFTVMVYVALRLGIYDQELIYYFFIGIGLILIFVYGIHSFYTHYLPSFLRDMDILFLSFLWISFGIGSIESMVFFYSYAFMGTLAFMIIFLYFKTLTLDGKQLLYMHDFRQALRRLSFRNMAFFIAVFSLACFVPTLNFWAMWPLIINIFRENFYFVAVVFLLGLIILTSQLLMIVLRLLIPKVGGKIVVQRDFATLLLFMGYVIFSIYLFVNVQAFFSVITNVIYELRGF